MSSDAPVVWSPTQDRIEQSNLWRFMQTLKQRDRVPLPDFASLHRWSVEYPEAFWSAVWDFTGVRASQPASSILDDGHLLPGARWFTGARLNYAENLLWGDDEQIAIIARDERGVRRELTYRELRQQVARFASGLRDAGIGEGDRVAAILPNIPEAVIAMLAVSSIGAIWSSCSPDFGVSALLDRLVQITPRILLVGDGYRYAGKTIDCLATAQILKQQMSSIERVVIVPILSAAPDLSIVAGSEAFDTFGSADAPLKFAQLPFDQPLFILYSSGTTGVPKCIVHCAGGALIQLLKEHVLHADMRTNDRFFYFTTCGWVVWNALTGGLATGATIVLFDGSPLHPDPRVLWRMAAEERVTIFGTGPRFLTACEQAGVKPVQEFDLGALRTIISTGAPLSPPNHEYVYRDVKSDVHLASMSGGTDIMACFGIGCPILPVRLGEMQSLSLGMKVEVFNDDARAVLDQQGELVCTAPFPSVPLGFWGDAQNERFHAAYFERFANVWYHGDLATLTSHGTLVVHGRSDAVLNPGGVRIGTAEIYRQVEKIEEVAESIAIAQEWQNDVRVVLFVRMRPGVLFDDAIAQRIRETIRRHATPRHVPARIVAVPDLPRTINGKLVELAIREAVHGRPVKNAGALANPESLEFFRDVPALRE